MVLHTIIFSFLAIPCLTHFPCGKSCQQTELSFEWEQQKLRAGTWQTLDSENRREITLLSFVQDDICLLFNLLYILCITAKLSRIKPAWRQLVLLPSAGQSTPGRRIRGRRQWWRWRRFCAWPISREGLAPPRTHGLWKSGTTFAEPKQRGRPYPASGGRPYPEVGGRPDPEAGGRPYPGAGGRSYPGAGGRRLLQPAAAVALCRRGKVVEKSAL